MPYNGAGTFQLPSGNPVVTGTIISSTVQNNTMNDIANNGLSNCITKDGQTTPTANIPLGGFRITGVADAVNAQDVVNARQIQNGALTALAAVSGTDTITASTSPAITAYVKGQYFLLFPAGANATTAVTLNINGLGAKNITKNGANALAIGDIPASGVVPLYYDGTQFQIVSLPRGVFLGVQAFTASGTYTPTPGATRAIVVAVGAGGGGGGCATTGASQVAIASAGNGGAYGELFIASGLSSQTVTIGAAGSAGSAGANNGGNGGSTSFGALLVCGGGQGGLGAAATSPPGITAINTTSSTVSGSGTILKSQVGLFAIPGIAINTAALLPSGGGGSPFGNGGLSTLVPSTGFGAGGPGASAGPNAASPTAGVAGRPGYLLVYEYA